MIAQHPKQVLIIYAVYCSQYDLAEQLNKEVFSVEKDTDMQKLKSLHTSAIGKMHQAA